MNGKPSHPPQHISRFSPGVLSGLIPTPAVPLVPATSVPKQTVSAASTALPRRLELPPSSPSPQGWIQLKPEYISDQTQCVHSRAESSKESAKDVKSVGTANGHNKDVGRTVNANRVDGKSDKRNEGRRSPPGGDGKSLSITTAASGDANKLKLSDLKDAILAVSLGHSRMNTTLKFYRFSSEDHTIQPWALYADYKRWAPIGLNNTGNPGCGWVALAGVGYTTGVPYQSGDISLSVDNIPLANPASSGICRTGNAIWVKEIKGHFWVRRTPQYPDAGLATALQGVPPRDPRVFTYIQRTPINLGSTGDPTTQAYNDGQVTVHGVSAYPTPAGTAISASLTATGVDWLSYTGDTTRAPEPRLTSDAKTWTPTTNQDNYVEDSVHRSPTVGTELYDVRIKREKLEYINTNPPFSYTLALTNPITLDEDWYMPIPKFMEHPVRHRFKGEGIKVTYADTAVAQNSIAAINQLRVKFWQSSSGAQWEATAANTASQLYTAAYTEFISYEFWVEFEDCRDDS